MAYLGYTWSPVGRFTQEKTTSGAPSMNVIRIPVFWLLPKALKDFEGISWETPILTWTCSLRTPLPIWYGCWNGMSALTLGLQIVQSRSNLRGRKVGIVYVELETQS